MLTTVKKTYFLPFFVAITRIRRCRHCRRHRRCYRRHRRHHYRPHRRRRHPLLNNVVVFTVIDL